MYFNKEQLNIRSVQEDDYSQICQLVQNQEELFYCFPKAAFPLTESVLAQGLSKRADATVVEQHEDKSVIAFANFLLLGTK